MVHGVRMCGAFITKKVPISLTVGAVIFFVIASVCFGMYGNAECGNTWEDHCDYYYQTNLMISAISCLVSGLIFLGVACTMFCMLHSARGEPPTTHTIAAAPVTTLPYVYPGQTVYNAQLYPSQAYPSQAYPSQAYPSQAYPSQAYPSQAYPSQAYPQEANPQESNPKELPNTTYTSPSQQHNFYT
ncbi:hypothetical protein OTU49_010740 [Cherax quadricarinatus]|uniref:Uncharacterized protein n=1 Tax=Cherax quadricarinatus TaxID=27406 RepID=A0AAW0W802_CHEQU